MAPKIKPINCVQMSFCIDHAATGSQFTPRLTGGVNKSRITIGPSQVRKADVTNAAIKITFKFLEKFFMPFCCFERYDGQVISIALVCCFGYSLSP
jgi:hypothetical protein